MLPKSQRPLNLKQRLAALTQAPSSPSSYVQPTSPMNLGSAAKRRFNAPWARRQDGAAVFGGENEELLLEVMSKMIYQAGVDYECVHCLCRRGCCSPQILVHRTRPMCVVISLRSEP
jgi:Rho GTPase-activating protein 1